MILRITAISFLCLFLTKELQAGIFPTDGDTLNFRIVPFKTATNARYSYYVLELAQGHYENEKDFEQNIIITANSNNAKWVEEVPFWGKDYTWRVVNKAKKKKNNQTGKLCYFRTGTSQYTDTSRFRMRIIDSATAYKDMFVVLDYAPVMYDMKGNLVWYIPDIPGVICTGRGLRDLCPTSTGTFTALNDFGAFEFDYHGKLIWQAPNDGKISGDTTEYYHHEFTKLSNGNYMIAGLEHVDYRVPDDADTSNFKIDNTVSRKNNWFYKKVDCPTLIEYNPKGEIVWSWKSSQHLDTREYFIMKHRSGNYNSFPHLNSFFFDEKNKAIYASLRNYDRIIKIKYPDGNIIAQYGRYLDSSGRQDGERLFHGQHCIKLTPEGDIVLFNNNTIRDLHIDSYIQKFREPNDNSKNLEKIWAYNCNIDTNAPSSALTGGGVHPLPDNSTLVAMGSGSRCFIVNPDKKITWNAIPELKLETGVWELLTVYRNYPILNKKHILYNFLEQISK